MLSVLFLLPPLPVPLLILLFLSLSPLLHLSPSHLSSVISLPPFCSVCFAFLPSPLSLALHSFVFALTATPAFGPLIAFVDFVFIHHEKRNQDSDFFVQLPAPLVVSPGVFRFAAYNAPRWKEGIATGLLSPSRLVHRVRFVLHTSAASGSRRLARFLIRGALPGSEDRTSRLLVYSISSPSIL
jgi:hypothetical protein